MQIHSQRLSPIEGGSLSPCVTRARDAVSGESLILRRAQLSGVRSSERVALEFKLSAALSDSGFVGGEDLLLSEGGLASYSTRSIDGVSLARFSFNSPAVLIATLARIARSLGYLHALGYIHADLKPDNILIEVTCSGPTSWVIDLGLACPIGSRAGHEIRGTDGFIAPEVYDGRALTPATDVFSFGRCLFALIANRQNRIDAVSLEPLATDCTQSDMSRRPQDFWEVLEKLAMIRLRLGETAVPHRLAPPLRGIAFLRRVRLLEKAVFQSGAQCNRVCRVFGVAGVGKTRLLRSFSAEQQSIGARTLRLTEVESWPEALMALPELIGLAFAGERPENGRDFVLISTTESTSENRLVLNELARLSTQFECAILLESHLLGPIDESLGVIAHTVAPLSQKECLAASGHLGGNAMASEANAEALAGHAGGIPRRMVEALSAHFELPSQRRLRTVLASNDERNALYSALRAHRAFRRLSGGVDRRLAAQISELQGRLGRPFDQRRWARRGVGQLLSEDPATVFADPTKTREILLMLSRAADNLAAERWLDSQITHTPDGDNLTRGLLVSELGWYRLLRSDLDGAIAALNEAAQLLAEDGTAGMDRLLAANRLGSALAEANRWDEAAQRFTAVASEAQFSGCDEINARANANLGRLARMRGQTAIALRHFRRAVQCHRRRRTVPESLTILAGLVSCNVDLGNGRRAYECARLANGLAQLLSDGVQLAYAANNLGWIQTTRGETGEARRNLDEAMRIRFSLNDSQGRAQVYLNQARLHLVAQSYPQARALCTDVLASCQHAHDEQGSGDALRVLARIALAEGEADRAMRHLAQAEEHEVGHSPRDLLENRLLRMEVGLWSGRIPSDAQFEVLSQEELIGNVYVFRIDLFRLAGFRALALDRLTDALNALGMSAQMARSSERYDKWLEVVPMLALLAERTRNRPRGLRYLTNAQSMVARMQEQLA